MDALISGQAGIAMLWDEDSVWSVTVESSDTFVPRSRVDVTHLFAGASDIVAVADISRDEAVSRMQRAWQFDRAMQMTLILLDSEEDEETRAMAAECAENHFDYETIEEYVTDRLYSAPLPTISDLPGAKIFATRVGAQRVVRFLQRLDDHQLEIIRVRRAWDTLGANQFASRTDQSVFEQVAISAGVFRRLAEAIRAGSVTAAHIAFLQDPRITAMPQHRAVLGHWIEPLKAHRVGKPVEIESVLVDADLDEEPETSTRKPRRSRKDRRNPTSRKKPSIHAQFETVKSELAAVEDLLNHRQYEWAQQRAATLIDRQLKEDGPEVAVKSLCNFASLAKSYALFDWQLELAKRAVQELPSDVQSRDQLADSYFCRQEFGQALALYEETCRVFPPDDVARNGHAEVLRKIGRRDEALSLYGETCQIFPQDKFARNGRAEVLRELGRLEEALSWYEDNCRMFPQDRFARSGRAEVLRELGRLDEALRLYEETCGEFPRDAATRNGRADLLHELGRLDEALRLYEDNCHMFPRDLFARNGQAEVLRKLGRLDEALRLYEETSREFPRDAVARNGQAEILRELGRLEETLCLYAETRREFPRDLFARNGQAEVLRELGRLDAALRLYEETCHAFPHDAFARYGRVSVLVDMRRYEEALSLLPCDRLQTHQDWIAFHIRGMIYLRQGKLHEAEQVFRRGMQECRFPSDVAFFCNAMALTKIQSRRYDEVDDVLGGLRTDVADVLRIHARSEKGETAAARDAFERIRSCQRRCVKELRDTLAAVYLASESVVFVSDELRDKIFALECALVQAA